MTADKHPSACTTLSYNTLNRTVIQCITPLCHTIHYTALSYNTLHRTVIQYITPHCHTIHNNTIQRIAPQVMYCTALNTGPRLGMWLVVPFQVGVMVGLGITYTVTAGQSLKVRSRSMSAVIDHVSSD